MDMLRIGICDDEREALESHTELVCHIMQKMGMNADIRKCHTGNELLIKQDLVPESFLCTCIRHGKQYLHLILTQIRDNRHRCFFIRDIKYSLYRRHVLENDGEGV